MYAYYALNDVIYQIYLFQIDFSVAHYFKDNFDYHHISTC